MANDFSSVDACIETIISEGLNPVVAAPPAYPFVGAKRVKAVLESNPVVQRATLCLMWHLQTESEQQKKDTEVRNRAGFMSSDAWHGSRIAERIVRGAPLEDEDEARLEKIACKYSKQLSVQLRRVAMIQDPRLASYAAIFSVH